MKIFISHATADRQLVQPLVDLLQLGAGVPHTDLFCSSISGSIPIGSYFVQHILTQLQAADLIVSVLSRSYFESGFCLAEAGAAQVLQIAKTATLYSLIVPPVAFTDLDGVLYGVQSGSILDSKALDGLRDHVTRGATSVPPTSTWNEKRDNFLANAKEIVGLQLAYELLKNLIPQDVYFDRTTDPGITYKLKLRIIWKNDTGHDLNAQAPNWKTTAGDVPAQWPAVSSLQVEGSRGWERGDWKKEGSKVHVPGGRAFRAWIGLDQSFNDDELRRRHETRRLGTLVLPVKIAGYQVELKMRL